MKRTKALSEWIQVLHNFAETPYVLQAQVDELKQSLQGIQASDKTTQQRQDPVDAGAGRPSRATQTRGDTQASYRSAQAKVPVQRPGTKRSDGRGHASLHVEHKDNETSPLGGTNQSLYRAARQVGFATSVLDAYPWNATNAEPFRGILRVQTSDGDFALKRTHISGQRVAFLEQLTRYTADRKFHRTSTFLKTKKGRAYAVRQNEVYYATRWLDGQQANFSSNQQVQAAARALARFHDASRGFDPAGFVPKMEFDLAKMLRERRSDLRALLTQCERRRSVDAFDEVFLDLKASLLADADDSLKHAETSACIEFLQDDQATPGICHLDVTPANIVIDTDGRAVLIDLDLATYAPRVLDLGHLLRRSLQQSHWDSQIAYTCFLEYHSVQPLRASEYQLVLALLRFPHRAWRLARSHYRDAPDALQLDELRSYRAQEEQRQKFLTELEAEIAKVES